ncbi:hypothetical protein N8772_03855 [Rickettsiales bacterium]|nr:hypothetical protein [Rickettsiales bacterium]
MSELDQIQKEAAIEAIFNKLLAFYKSHAKKIITFCIIIVICAISFASYSLYIKNLNQKYSAILQELFLKEDYPKDQLQILINQDHSKAIKFIASMQYAKSLINENKNNEAIDLYLSINKDKNHDQFFREYSGIIAIKNLVNINDNKKYDIMNIIDDIYQDTSILKDYITEQKAIYLWKNKRNKESKEIFTNLTLDIEVSSKIKDRARMMLEIAF